VYQGFPQADSFEAVEAMTQTFYTEGSLPDYDSRELCTHRTTMIHSTIGFSDGYNHIRAAYYLEQTLKEPLQKKREKPSMYYKAVYWALRILAPLYNKRIFSSIPWLARKLWVFERYSLNELPKLQTRYQTYLDNFYANEKIAERFQAGTLFSSILKRPQSK
jgi:hypothetical protein